MTVVWCVCIYVREYMSACVYVVMFVCEVYCGVCVCVAMGVCVIECNSMWYCVCVCVSACMWVDASDGVYVSLYLNMCAPVQSLFLYYSSHIHTCRLLYVLMFV